MRTTRTKIRSSPLGVLNLEDRSIPSATIAFASGNLTVTGDNTSNTILLTGTEGAITVFVAPGNQFAGYPGNLASIMVPANNKGTYNVLGDIKVNGGNSADSVFIVIDDGGLLPGQVNASLGNGADNFIMNTANNAPRATLAGNLEVAGGLGADNIFVDDFVIGGRVDIFGAGSGFRTDNGITSPNDVFEIRDVTVTNNVFVTNAITFLGDFFEGEPNPLPNVIEGNLTVTNTQTNQLGKYQLDGSYFFPGTFPGSTATGYSGALGIGRFSTVQGNVTYTGSGSNDAVAIIGTVQGNVVINAGDGINDFGLGQNVPGDPTPRSGFINGSLTYTGGFGIDGVSLIDGSTVDGSVTFNTGDGVNLYDLDNQFVVNGAFNINAGNQSDDVGSVAGGIAGDQAYKLGNGNNSLVWDGAGRTTSANFEFSSGSGTDALTINGINAFNLRVAMGAGNDTFTYGADGGPVTVGSAYIDLGFGTDTYNDNGNPITWPQTIIDP